MLEQGRGGSALEAFLLGVWDAAELRRVDVTATRLAQLAVKSLCDWCAIDLVGVSDELRRVAVAHRSASAPERLEPIDPRWMTQVRSSRCPLVLDRLTGAEAAELRVPEELSESASVVLLPLSGQERMLGLATMVDRGARLPLDEPESLMRVATRMAGRIETATLFETLAATNARLTAIIDRSATEIFVKDTRGRYELVNQAFASRLGRTRDEVVGLTDFDLHPPEVARSLRENDAVVLRTGGAMQHEEQVESVDGIHTSISVKFPIPSLDGRGLSICGISTDITDRKRAEQELLKTSSFRDRLLGIVSHDLRNPLNAIMLSASSLMRREDLPGPSVKALHRILTSGERMHQIISDLLDFTRGRLGSGIPVVRTEVDVLPFLRDVVAELEISSPQREIRLAHKGTTTGCFDASRVAQAVSNLLRNALTYSPEGTPVAVSVEGGPDAVSIEVHNEGRPISPELLPHVFDAFRQGRGDRGGLGLGLFIVHEIAVSHGGEVKVRSSKEEGTSFTLHLPRR